MLENRQENTLVNREKVDSFIMSNQKYFPASKIFYLKEKLYGLTESKFSRVYSLDLKDPTTNLIVSIFLGSLGVDRFMLGDTGMGILKLLTGGCCGILTLVDWFTIQNKTKEKNFNDLMLLF